MGFDSCDNYPDTGGAGRMSRLPSWMILPAALSAFMARVILTRWAPVKKLRSSWGNGNGMTIPCGLMVPYSTDAASGQEKIARDFLPSFYFCNHSINRGLHIDFKCFFHGGRLLSNRICLFVYLWNAQRRLPLYGLFDLTGAVVDMGFIFRKP